MELPQVDEEWRFKMKGFKMEYRPTIWPSKNNVIIYYAIL